MAGEVALANYPANTALGRFGAKTETACAGPTDCGCVVPAKTKVPGPRRPAMQVSPVRAAYAQDATGPNLFGEGEEKVGWRARELLRRASANQGAVNVRT